MLSTKHESCLEFVVLVYYKSKQKIEPLEANVPLCVVQDAGSREAGGGKWRAQGTWELWCILFSASCEPKTALLLLH